MPSKSSTADIHAHLPVAPRDYLILFVLADSVMHGHAMLKAMETGAGGVPCDPANLYRSLRKLERSGLVTETEGTNEDEAPSGPPRRLYRLTKLGRSVLTAEADRLASLADAARKRNLTSPVRR